MPSSPLNKVMTTLCGRDVPTKVLNTSSRDRRVLVSAVQEAFLEYNEMQCARLPTC